MKRTVIGRCRSALIFLFAVLLVGCSGEKPASVYADAESWAYAETDVTDKTADVFFVTPTVCLGTEEKLSWDSYDEETKASFVGAINMEKGIYDDDARFFAPFYHQAALSAYYAPAESGAAAFDTAYADVKEAFDHYMANWNGGRPLILAGFSQGAQMCIRLLEEYAGDPAVSKVLVACYAIGWRFTEEQAQYPQIKFAQGERNTGVLFPDGTYHLYDYQFFYRNLEENVQERIRVFAGE